MKLLSLLFFGSSMVLGQSAAAACKLNETAECKAGIVSATFDISNFPPGSSKTFTVETFTRDPNLELLVEQHDRYGLPFQVQRFPLKAAGFEEIKVKVTSMKPPSKFGDGFMNINWALVPKGEHFMSAVSSGSSEFCDPY